MLSGEPRLLRPPPRRPCPPPGESPRPPRHRPTGFPPWRRVCAWTWRSASPCPPSSLEKRLLAVLLGRVGTMTEATPTDALQFTPIGKGIRPELILPGLDDPHLAVRGRELLDHVGRESWQHLIEVEGALLVRPHRRTTIPETHRIARLGIVVVLDQPAAAYAVDLGTLGHHSVLV